MRWVRGGPGPYPRPSGGEPAGGGRAVVPQQTERAGGGRAEEGQTVIRPGPAGGTDFAGPERG